MTAGGGRRPPGGPPRDLHSLGLRPDGERPGQVVSLSDIWHTEALIDALATNRTIPPSAATDPAITLLAALRHDLDPATPAAPVAAGPEPPAQEAARPPKPHGARPWPLPIRVLATAVAVAAVAALVALVQPPWPTAGTRPAAPLAGPLAPAAQIRPGASQPTTPQSPPMPGTPSWVPPPTATSPAQPAPPIPADTRSGPASAARPPQQSHPGPTTPNGLPSGPVPAYHPAASASGLSGPVTVRRSNLRRLPRAHTGPGATAGHPHSRPGTPAPAAHHPGATFHHSAPISAPGTQGGPPVGQQHSPAAHPWQFWMRTTARAHHGTAHPAW